MKWLKEVSAEEPKKEESVILSIKFLSGENITVAHSIKNQTLKMTDYPFNKQPRKFKFQRKVLMIICSKSDLVIGINSTLMSIITIKSEF